MHMFPPQIPTLESECADGQQLQVDAKGANLSLSSLPTIVTTSDGYQHPAASACQWRAAAVEASPPDVLSPLYPYSPLSAPAPPPVFPLTNETPTLALPIPNTCSWNPSLNELTFHSPSPIPIDHPFTLSYSPDFRDGGSAHLSPLLPDLKLPPSDDLLAGPETPPSPSPLPLAPLRRQPVVQLPRATHRRGPGAV
ncbi:hypothetical protein MKEN_01245600 [Mycena kentingensis (nom. inval.)]|nr:hypothetical protein MKEN_01245600 [Mycena kentingensis (nom. inval.)]